MKLKQDLSRLYCTFVWGLTLPKKGYKVITIPEPVYEALFMDWMREKDTLILKGIRSFSGYVSHRISLALEEKKKTEE